MKRLVAENNNATLAHQLVSYIRDYDPYNFADDYDNDEEMAFNDIKKSLDNNDNIDAILDDLQARLEDLAYEDSEYAEEEKQTITSLIEKLKTR